MSVRTPRFRQRGQVLPIFAGSIVATILLLGVAIDGGYAYSQNRTSQNAADFAAMAGTRIVGEELVGNSANGTALTVYNAVIAALTAQHATLASATYVDALGAAIPGGDVAAIGTSPDGGNYGTIPPGASGVVVNAKVAWRPFFLGVVGITNWTASTTATAVTAGQSLGGGVLPVGLSSSTISGLTQCPVTNLTSCVQQNLTPGSANIAGGFGWLSFGATAGCAGSGLGMDTTRGCGTSQGFLDSQAVPPADSYGCCAAVDPSGTNLIASLPGNKWADLSFYTQHDIATWVPIWDTAGGGGSNGYYHIVGFAAVIFAGEDIQHGKWLTGAAVSGVGCPGSGNTVVSGYSTTICAAPGGAISLGATGGVRLVH